MTALQKAKVQELRSSGLSYAGIAAALNISVGTIKSFCSRHIVQSSTGACKRCGGKLVNTPGHRQKTFCSTECRQLYWQENPSLIRRRSAVTQVCIGCGTEFIDYADRHRKYCSHRCYIADRYKEGDVDEKE